MKLSKEVLFSWLQHLTAGEKLPVATTVLQLDSNAVLDAFSIDPVQTGGFSGARIWKVIDAAGKAWCLRRWPTGGPNREHLDWIHSQLFMAAASGISFLSVPVPSRPFGKTAVEFDGHLWELSPWLMGEAVLKAGYDRSAMTAAIEAAIELHVALDFGSSAATQSGGRVSSSPALVKRERHLKRAAVLLDQLQLGQRTGTLEIESGLVVEASNAIRQCSSRLNAKAEKLVQRKFRLQPVLSDLWCEHVLFDNNKVSGIIDYGSLCLDIAELPFARLVGSVAMLPGKLPISDTVEAEGDDGWRLLQETVEAGGSRFELEAEILDFLHQTNVILGCLNWLEWIFVQYREFADPKRAAERASQMMRAASALAAATR